MKRKIRKLKRILHRAIEDHGRDSPVVLEISRELDLYIVREMKKRKNNIEIRKIN